MESGDECENISKLSGLLARVIQLQHQIESVMEHLLSWELKY